MKRFIAIFAILVAILPALAQDKADAEREKSALLTYVEDRLSTPDRKISFRYVEGILSSDAKIGRITIADRQGVWLEISKAEIIWTRSALLTGRLVIDKLTAESIEVSRKPLPDKGAPPAPGISTIPVPELPVSVNLNELAVNRVTFDEDVFGLASELSVAGHIAIDAGQLRTGLEITRLDGPGGRLDLNASYSGETNVLDLDLALFEPEDGVVANLLNVYDTPAVNLNLKGSGEVSDLKLALTLDADEVRVLTGQARFAGFGADFRFDIDAAGPVGQLVRPDLRDLFGARSELVVTGKSGIDGGLDIERFMLSGGALRFSGSLRTAPNGFPLEIAADGTIRSPAGAPVVLPLPGVDTRVNRASINFRFGGGGAATWSGRLIAGGFSTAGLTARELDLDLGGTALNLDRTALREVTFVVDGKAVGFASADPAIAEAIGANAGLEIAGVWRTGKPIVIDKAILDTKAVDATFVGNVSDFAFDGAYGAKISDASVLSVALGRDMSGVADLSADGVVSPVTGAFDLTLDGRLDDFAIGSRIDGLLLGRTVIKGSVARDETGTRAGDFTVENPQLFFQAEGLFGSETTDFQFSGEIADVGRLSDRISGGLVIDGGAKGVNGTIDLDVAATLEGGSVTGKTLSRSSFGFSGVGLPSGISGKLTGLAFVGGERVELATDILLAEDRRVLGNLKIQAGATRLSGGLSANENDLVDGDLSLTSDDISIFAALFSFKASGRIDLAISLAAANGRQDGQISGGIASVAVEDFKAGSGELDIRFRDLFGAPSADFELRGTDVRILRLVQSGIPSLKFAASGSFAGEVLTLAGFEASSDEGLAVFGSGRIPLSGSGLDLSLDGTASLSLANRRLASRGARVEGTARFAGNVAGSVQNPAFSGRVSTEGASYADPLANNLTLKNIALAADLAGDRIVIRRGSANPAAGGGVSLAGSVSLDGSAGYPADLRIDLDSARYSGESVVMATMSGNLGVTGALIYDPLVSGSITVHRAELSIPETIAGAADGINVRHINPPGKLTRTLQFARADDGTPVPGGRPIMARLDISLNAPDRIFIRGRGLDAELGGRVALTGPVTGIRPVGGFQLIRGRLSILGKRIVFDEGTVTLVGDLDPFVRFVANSDAGDATVRITVTGRVSDPAIVFSSEPELPQDEVLSRLIFGRSITELSALQVARLVASATQLAGGGDSTLLDSFRQSTGLDELDVVTDSSGDAAVRAGRYINDNIYLGVEAGASGSTRGTINIDITDSLKATGAAGSDGNSSIGVFLEKDY